MKAYDALACAGSCWTAHGSGRATHISLADSPDDLRIYVRGRFLTRRIAGRAQVTNETMMMMLHTGSKPIPNSVCDVLITAMLLFR